MINLLKYIVLALMLTTSSAVYAHHEPEKIYTELYQIISNQLIIIKELQKQTPDVQPEVLRRLDSFTNPTLDQQAVIDKYFIKFLRIEKEIKPLTQNWGAEAVQRKRLTRRLLLLKTRLIRKLTELEPALTLSGKRINNPTKDQRELIDDYTEAVNTLNKDIRKSKINALASGRITRVNIMLYNKKLRKRRASLIVELDTVLGLK